MGNSGSAEIVELTVNASDVSGYAAFEGGHLARAVFINLNAWLSDSTGARPSTHIDLSFVSSSPGKAYGRAPTAQRLVINHADDVSNLTFAGQSYENANVQPTGPLVREPVDLSEGIDLSATEAILIDFD